VREWDVIYTCSFEFADERPRRGCADHLVSSADEGEQLRLEKQSEANVSGGDVDD
jgi:hypothetical protein